MLYWPNQMFDQLLNIALMLLMFWWFDFMAATAVRIYHEYTYHEDFSECNGRLQKYSHNCSAAHLHNLAQDAEYRMDAKVNACAGCPCALACAVGSTPTGRYYNKRLARTAQTILHDRNILNQC